MTERDSAIDRLHAVPLEDFVSERKRLAKELRAAGDREASAELAKLPKPSAPAWALNQLAREEPETVGAWLDAAEALRDASTHADRASGDALRAAIAGHREATRGLLAAVRERTRPNGRRLSEPMLDRVRELLQAATADPAAGERLRAGRTVESEDEDGAPLPEPAEKGRPAKAAKAEAADDRGSKGRPASARAAKADAADDRGSKARPAQGAKADAADDRGSKARAAEERAAREREAEARAELERLVAAAERRLEELREAAAEAESADAKAAERLEEAQRTLHRSESEAAAARAAAQEAGEAAEQAERELRTLTAKLSS